MHCAIMKLQQKKHLEMCSIFCYVWLYEFSFALFIQLSRSLLFLYRFIHVKDSKAFSLKNHDGKVKVEMVR